jgi:putative tryptophan/tyrosine transport system substrate-binding protein
LSALNRTTGSGRVSKGEPNTGNLADRCAGPGVRIVRISAVFGEIDQDRPDAIIVSDISEIVPYRQLIVELVAKSRLPAMYPFRLWVEAGGLMAYGTDLVELWRRMADDVHEILNGANPGDIPIYQPTKFELVINMKAAKRSA